MPTNWEFKVRWSETVGDKCYYNDTYHFCDTGERGWALMYKQSGVKFLVNRIIGTPDDYYEVYP